MLYKTDRIRREFHGEQSIEIILNNKMEKTIVLFRPEMRAMFIALDYEINRIFGVQMMMTDVLRTWKEQDEIYPETAEMFGPGFQNGKIISPHQCGRGGDAVPVLADFVDLTNKAYNQLTNNVYSHAVEYLNKYSPYCWNNPKRLLVGCKIVKSHYKTARDHNVGRGRHIHGQISW